MLYSIIDIETTGGHASGNRIIEIAIFNFDGENIVDTYQTLINPERRIHFLEFSKVAKSLITP